ncbi:MAG: glycosyltransferase [Ignavibacteria bacterium]
MPSEAAHEKFILIFTLSMPWKNYHREQFIRSIASEVEDKGGYVICMEPTILSLFNLLKYPERIIEWLKGNNNFRKDGPNIYVTHAKTFEHVLSSSRFKILSFINRRLIKRQVNRLIKKIDNTVKDFVWVLHRPELHFLIGYTGEKGAVYDCCDDHILTSDMKSLKVAGNLAREESLSKKSDFVITTSSKLFKRNKLSNNNTFIIENGHNFTEILIDKKVENILRGIKKPIIGYIGIIRKWIDFDLLNYILSENKELSFVFVGEIYKDSVEIFKELKLKYKNLYLTGRVKYNALPEVMNYFDVGIIPFKQNEFMESVNPNKFYEMLSRGVPIVSTNIGDLKEKYSDISKISDTKEEFERNIKDFLAMDKTSLSELKARMRSLSGSFTWRDKARYFYSLLNEHILNK